MAWIATTFTARDVGVVILGQSFCCAPRPRATRDIICFALDPFLFRCLRLLVLSLLLQHQETPMSYESTEKLSQSNIRKRKRASGLAMSKKKRKLLAFYPTEDTQRRLGQIASLATALNASGTEYSDELIYRPGMALRFYPKKIKRP
ncbi:uncharacterized protein LOC111280281 isoform X2 [Durio zibethinus]|uniref:Uncharacterized protein LOC111280281 isoform X2 n=1 Tax=Durio zibethinus TaxID=66656 RepID=A0A6P5X5W3_DURZI|nr:uncharacterized protein LOC111280281 isoform X2 [Durio zibethinus]